MGHPRLVDRNLQDERCRSAAWLADVLDKIANRHPMSKIDELLPWAYINNGAKRPQLWRTPPSSLARRKRDRGAAVADGDRM